MILAWFLRGKVLFVGESCLPAFNLISSKQQVIYQNWENESKKQCSLCLLGVFKDWVIYRIIYFRKNVIVIILISLYICRHSIAFDTFKQRFFANSSLNSFKPVKFLMWNTICAKTPLTNFTVYLVISVFIFLFVCSFVFYSTYAIKYLLFCNGTFSSRTSPDGPSPVNRQADSRSFFITAPLRKCNESQSRYAPSPRRGCFPFWALVALVLPHVSSESVFLPTFTMPIRGHSKSGSRSGHLQRCIKHMGTSCYWK